VPLQSGSRIGDYEITSLLGTGGMGEVYRGRDLRLDREVAIKVLREAFSRDADRRSRFDREARLLASLNHPNIATIHGVETFGEAPAIVLELVEGPTLADRLDRMRGKGLPVAEAGRYALEIAAALEVAHRHHVVHRDLKPANVKLTTNGSVKVLDFGIAKLSPNAPEDAEAAPTATATAVGGVVGTPAYMSPEQAVGAPVDHRSDIFSFGCVLFEMFSGVRAFDAPTPSTTLSRVTLEAPDWTRLPPDLSPRLREIIELCLVKDVNQRRQSIGDVRLDLERALAAREAPSTAPTGRAAWAVAALATLGAIVAVVWPADRVEPAGTETRVEVTTPRSVAPHEFALSPDGQTIVFRAPDESGNDSFWLRSIATGNAVAVGESGSFPFWSHDGQSIGFFAPGQLRRMDRTGRALQDIAAAPLGRGGSWNADNVILFVGQQNGPVQRVMATGGEVRTATTLLPGHSAHRFPAFLPDGRHFIYFATGTVEAQGIYMGALDDSSAVRLTAADSAAVVLPPDRIIYNTGGVIVSRQLDIANARLVGPASTIVESSPINPFSPLGLSVSNTGVIAFRAWVERRALRWFDRAGTPLGSLGEPDTSSVRAPRISPDGRKVMLDRAPNGNRDLWLQDLETGTMTRFTTDRALDGMPTWSRDSKRTVFHSDRAGTYDLYQKDVDAAPSESLILKAPGTQTALGFTTDGHLLLYRDDADIRALPLTGSNRSPITIAGSEFSEVDGTISPDSRWVAYVSNESGRFEIYVQAFPSPAARRQVSTNGGIGPRWSPTGRELYFVAPDAKLMAVRAPSSAEPSFGKPVALFQTRIVSATNATNQAEYDVSPDGRFLVNEWADEVPTPITLILNWRPH
jgi:serine/threonine protein kinase/Tol biopolymer transport system component